MASWVLQQIEKDGWLFVLCEQIVLGLLVQVVVCFPAPGLVVVVCLVPVLGTTLRNRQSESVGTLTTSLGDLAAGGRLSQFMHTCRSLQLWHSDNAKTNRLFWPAPFGIEWIAGRTLTSAAPNPCQLQWTS